MSNCGDSVAVAYESGDDRGVEDNGGLAMVSGITIRFAIESEARRVKKSRARRNILMGFVNDGSRISGVSH